MTNDIGSGDIDYKKVSRQESWFKATTGKRKNNRNLAIKHLTNLLSRRWPSSVAYPGGCLGAEACPLSGYYVYNKL